MKKNLFALCAFVLALPLCAQQLSVNKQIDSLLSYYETKNAFMGSVTLSENGKIVFDKAYGYSNVEQNKKANKDTKYKIGSITKMFTASVIFQLIEEGKLSLETKLSQFYPDIQNADHITIGNLLAHRSGIFNYTNDDNFASFYRTNQTKEMMIGRIKSYSPAFVPDSKSEYSNSNYILLGYIIEDVTKKTYDQNITERIIKKLDLKRTSYAGIINTANNEAFSYASTDGKWAVEDPWDMSLAGAAGAIVSTTADLTIFIQALFNGKIVKQTSLDEMMKLQDGYGKGMFQVPFNEKKGYGHTGGIEEFRSQLFYFPQEKVALAICGNAKGENNNDIAIGILSYYFKKPFAFPSLDNAKISEAVFIKYEGTYSSPSFPMKIMIRKVGNNLSAQATGQSSFTLDAKSETEFTFKPAGIVMVFSTGQVILKQGGGEFILKKE